MEDILRLHQGKMDSKKAQLTKVQGMFKSFAQELEANFKSSSLESDRDWYLGAQQRGHRKELTKSEGTVSLPNILSKRVPSKSPKAPGRSPKAVDFRCGYPGEDELSQRGKLAMASLAGKAFAESAAKPKSPEAAAKSQSQSPQAAATVPPLPQAQLSSTTSRGRPLVQEDEAEEITSEEDWEAESSRSND
mmetsp:Transcript_74486/g.166745  ORF Transcript_74486/g.166745 Transcript_74486/m.166745 type:complete len:191 (-) Transcript_74486:30-602(-)